MPLSRKKFPPLTDTEAWQLSPEWLALRGISSSEAEDGIAILKILAALGLDTPETAIAFLDECDDVPGSKAWIRKHRTLEGWDDDGRPQ